MVSSIAIVYHLAMCLMPMIALVKSRSRKGQRKESQIQSPQKLLLGEIEMSFVPFETNLFIPTAFKIPS